MICDWRIAVTTALILSYPTAGHTQAAAPQQSVPARATVEARSFPLPSSDSSSIRGVVVDQSGAPLSRVRVRILGAAMVVSVTDALGAFHAAALPGGQYVVRAYLTGYAVARSERINLVPGSAPSLRLTMVRDGAEVKLLASEARPAELEAGLGFLRAPVAVESQAPVEAQGQADGDAGDPDEDGEENRRESVWRLRHLPRSPLKDQTASASLPDSVTNEGFTPDPMGMLGRAVGTSVRMASALWDLSLSGQVNLLTSGAFDRPDQLFSSNQFARNVAYVSLGSDAGDLGDWTVRGAMTQGDVSSWILAGSIAAPGTSRHAYDMGISYSMQRYAGGNPAALAAITDGARNAAEIYGFDRWNLARRLALGYGARYSRYDYLTGGGWLSPRVSATVTPVDRLRVRALAARRMVAPGAEEFVPTTSAGLWLPPERTFSPLLAHDKFRVERSDHYELAVEHDIDPGMVVAFRAYRQNVDDQLATFFNVRRGTAGPPDLGHYYVATAGDVQTRGWTAGVSQQVGTVQGTVEYTMTRSTWILGGSADALTRTSATAARLRMDEVADLTTSLRAQIPQSATRLFVLYRINSGFARLDDAGTAARFDVQINQSLPFLNFSDAQWEMLLDVRNLFREPAADASAYDEILVVNPPKRIVGGLLLRF